MTIKQDTAKAGNVALTGPQGQTPTVTFISFDPGTGDAIYTYNKTFTYLDNGSWAFTSTADEPVTDDAGNPVSANSPLGSFTVNIAQPADTTPPTVTPVSVSPTTITASGAQTVTLTVRYADA